MRADRLLSMLMLLQTRGQMTAEELAERLEVSSRTIFRDLEALSGAGVPVYSERGAHGGIALLENYRTNLTGLNRDEVRALFMFTVPGLLAELPASKTQEAANLKLVAALPAPFQKDVTWVRQRIHLDPGGWFHPAEATPFLAVAQEAVWQNRRLRISYRRSDGVWVKRLLEPYGLVAKAGVWYLVARIQGWMQVFRVGRILEAALTETTFERLTDFDLPAFWAKSAAEFEQQKERYPVTLRVAPEGIPGLVQIFGDWVHEPVTAAPVDERGRSQFTLTFESMEAACRQLIGAGRAIEIVGPDELRRHIRQRALEVASFYS